MSRMYLLPRLSRAAFLARWEQMPRDRSPERLRQEAMVRDPAQTYGATGGTRLPDDRLQELRDRILAIATPLGYPRLGSQKALRTFDLQVTQLLAGSEIFRTGDVWRNDVWSFIGLVLLPDLVEWRFPDAGEERFAGGMRNTFQRLWRRGFFMDRGEEHSQRWELVDRLTEDAFAAILERTSLGGSPAIARLIAEVWVETLNRIRGGGMESITRDATKALRAYNVVISFDSLTEEELLRVIRDAFNRQAGLSDAPAAPATITDSGKSAVPGKSSENTTSAMIRRFFGLN